MLYIKLIMALITIKLTKAFNINDINQNQKETLFTDSNINLISTSFKQSQRKCFNNQAINEINRLKYLKANENINELIIKESNQFINRIGQLSIKTDLNNLRVKLKYYDLIRNDPDESDRLYHKLELDLLKQNNLKGLNNDSGQIINELLEDKLLRETTINDILQKNLQIPFDANKTSNLIKQIDIFYATFDNKRPNENYSPLETNNRNLLNEFKQFLTAKNELDSYVTKWKGMNNHKIISILKDLNINGEHTKPLIYKLLKRFSAKSDPMIQLDQIEEIIHKTIEAINRCDDSFETSLLVDYEFKHVKDRVNMLISRELNDYILSISKLDFRIDLSPLRKDLIEDKFQYFESLVIGSHLDQNRSMSLLEMDVIKNDLDRFLRNALLSEKIQMVQVVKEVDSTLSDLTKYDILKRVYSASNAKHWVKNNKETHDYMLDFFSYSTKMYKQSFNQTLFDQLAKTIDVFYQLFDNDFASSHDIMIGVFNDFIKAELKLYNLFIKETLFDNAIKNTLFSRKQINYFKSFRTSANIFLMIFKRSLTNLKLN